MSNCLQSIIAVRCREIFKKLSVIPLDLLLTTYSSVYKRVCYFCEVFTNSQDYERPLK